MNFKPAPTHPEQPFLWLDLEAFERNVADIAGHVVAQGGKRWRPHVKALRSPAIARRLQAAGAQGVTVATVQEARTMVEGGIGEVMVASQVVGAAQLRLLAELNRRAEVIVAVDGAEQLQRLAQAGRAAGVVLPVVIEVDVGLQRAGIAPGEAVPAFARQVQACPELRLRGLMAWEGHVTRIADASERRAAIESAVGSLVHSAALCRAAGLPMDIVSCGGTGTYRVTSQLPGVTELQAGGGVFGDLRYREDFGLPLAPALFLRATVLSRPRADRIVCDAGWRYLAVYPKAPRPCALPGVARLAHAAEHLSIDCAQAPTGCAVGDRIDFEVGYADATVFLHTALHLVRAGVLEEVLRLPARGTHHAEQQQE